MNDVKQYNGIYYVLKVMYMYNASVGSAMSLCKFQGVIHI